MSWNFQTQLNNLKIQVAQLSAGSVTNPLTSALNCASYPLNNATTLTATAGQNLSLNTSVGRSVIVNAPLSIPNHPLIITNNTASDSIVISDSNPDTSTFRIDASGNVGIKADPTIPLAYDLTVNGNTNITGDLSANNIVCNSITAPTVIASNVVNNITAGTGLVKTGTSTNPTLSNAGVTSAVAGTGIGVSGATGAVTINNTGVTSAVAGTGISVSGGTGAVTINNTGVLGVSAGSSGISVSGTAQNPVINNTGVTQLTAGPNITLSSGVGNVTISATSGPSTWVSTATSALNMSNFGINNVASANAATDVAQINNVQSSVNRFEAGTNFWFLGSNVTYPISSYSFAQAPNTLGIYGIVYNGTPYQGTQSNILPPSRFTINWRCPVATNWPTGYPYFIRCELLSYDNGAGTILNWLDTQTVTGWIYNTGPNGSPANTPYLGFDVTLCSNTSCPIDIFGNGRLIMLNLSIAVNSGGGGNYAFNSAAASSYQDCAGVEVTVTTLAGSTGQGF
jgi:hypothetical protein